WAWWDGFDPYYSTCSVFAVRVNFNWWWGYPCWTGFVPYYYYAVVPSCPPYYRPYVGTYYSSWDGWTRWRSMWGDHIVRYKPAPAPTGYVPPITAGDGRYVRRPSAQAPPGFRDPNRGTTRGFGSDPRVVRSPGVGRLVPPDSPDRQPRDPVATRLVTDRGNVPRPTMGRFPSRQAPDREPQPIYGSRRGFYERPSRSPMQGGRPEANRGRMRREPPPSNDPSPSRDESAPRIERSSPPRQDGGGRTGWSR